MKQIIKYLSIAVAVMGVAHNATAQTMIVTTNDGQKHQFKTSDVKEVTFDGVGLENGPFEVTVTDVTSASAKLSVVPENNSQAYYYDVCLRSDYNRTSVKSIVENYITQLSNAYPSLDMTTLLSGLVAYGPDSDVVTGLPSNADMVCYAIGVNDAGQCVGEPTVVPFHTLATCNPEDCTFQLSYTDLSSSSLTVVVKPSDAGISYWMGVVGKFDYPGDEQMTAAVKASLQEACESYNRDMSDVVAAVTFRGDISVEESGLESDRPYYIYVYAIDENGDAAGPMFKTEFVTASEANSDAAVYLTYRYFDGDALAKAYPEQYEKAKGGVVLQPVFTPNENAVHYFWALSGVDMTDKTKYPDETTKTALQIQGYTDVPTKNMLVRYGKVTFLYYATDQWGLDGELVRMLVDVTKEGCSPVESYSEIEVEDTNATESVPLTVKMQKGKASDSESRIRARINKLRAMPTPMRSHELF